MSRLRITTLYYLVPDHLGSTSLTLDATGQPMVDQRYHPFGATRYASADAVTAYQYTGQHGHAAHGFEPDLGLYYYDARWYDPALGRFIQADTIVPDAGDVLAFDRYAYVKNNPLRYVDPTGHYYYDPGCDCLVTTKNPEREWEHQFNQDWIDARKPGTPAEFTTPERLQMVEDLKESLANSGQLFETRDERIHAGESDYTSFSIYVSLPVGKALSLIGLGVTAASPVPGDELVAFGLTLLSGLFSGGGTVTIDRYGQVYFAPGLSAGRTLPKRVPVSVSLTHGYYSNPNAGSVELETAIKGPSTSAGLTSILGINFVGWPWPTDARFVELGKVLGVGVNIATVQYTFPVVDLANPLGGR